MQGLYISQYATNDTIAMRHYLILATLAVAVGAALIAVAHIGTSSATDMLIVPNRSIGPVVLGETQSQISQILGDGRVLRRSARHTYGNLGLNEPQMSVPGYALVLYSKAGLEVNYVTSGPYRGRAVDLITTDPRYRTGTGIGVGSPTSSIEATARCYPNGQTRGSAATTDDPRAAVMCIDQDDLGRIGGNLAATYYTARGGQVRMVYIAGGPRNLTRTTAASS